MGLPDLFDVISQYDNSILIAQLAEEHHRRHGRALRLAIDEADWRFNNLTQAQVYAIRDNSDEAFQGIEKMMFYRICRLLAVNIQLVFVFDGPGRPWKRGRRGNGKIDYRQRDLLRELLRCFGIPSHEAPGEAEAECARLQILGIVDAVWSQDSDCLMFGCTLWLRDDRVAKQKGSTDRSKENTAKDKKHARILKAEDLKSHLQIDREGLVLYAMLAGGDYNQKGLPGCGSSTAMKLVKKGLGPSLCSCRNQEECNDWAARLKEALRCSDARSITVPDGFPEFKILDKYNNPNVSSDETLLNHPRLNRNYAKPINELKLLEVTSSRFNIWGRLYMNWVGPVLLARYMVARGSEEPLQVVHGIKLTRRMAKKTPSNVPTRVFERRLTFSPFGLTSLRRENFEGERAGYWDRDVTIKFDPHHRVEFEMPEYWLRKVLPPEVLDPPTPAPKSKPSKRKRSPDPLEKAAESPAARKRKRKALPQDSSVSPNVKAAQSKALKPNEAAGPRLDKRPSQRKGKQTPMGHNPDIIELSDSEDELRLPTPRLRKTSSLPTVISEVIDFGSPSSLEEDVDCNNVATGVHKTPVSAASNTPRRMYGSTHATRQPLSVMSIYNKSSSPALRSAPSISPLKPLSFVPPAVGSSTVAPLQAEDVSRPIAGRRIGSEGYQRPAAPTKARFSTSNLAESAHSVRESVADDAAVAVYDAESIRDARLRHFQSTVQSPRASAVDTLPAQSLPFSGSSRRNNYIPEGAQCIDLTED